MVALYVYKLCCICLSSGLELFGDVCKRVDWDVEAAGVCFHDKTGDRHVDFKNERGLRQKKKKFEKSKEDDGDRSNEALLGELSEVTMERYVAPKLKFLEVSVAS